MKKLHLGCGLKKLDGYINVDIREDVNPDLIEDISTLKSIENNSIDLIYACHTLEHFGRNEYINVLSRWHEILKSGGVLKISVPDIRKAAQLLIEEKYSLKQLMGLIYGGQTHKYNYHYVGFDFNTLKEDLEEIGFYNVRIWDWRKTEHCNTDDFSQAYLPHMDKENGILVSLNIEANKK